MHETYAKSSRKEGYNINRKIYQKQKKKKIFVLKVNR